MCSEQIKTKGEIFAEIVHSLKVPKNQFNSFGKYKYRSAEDILTALKPLLKPYHWSTYSTTRVEVRGNHNYQVTSSCFLDENLQLVGVPSDGWAREDEHKKGMDAPQMSGTATSYSVKRSWGNYLGIDDEKDSDGINKHDDNGGKVSNESDAKDQFYSAAREDQIEELERLIDQSTYDRTTLKKPLTEFTDTQIINFYRKLKQMISQGE